MDSEEKLKTLAKYIYDTRQAAPSIWHVGVPDEEPITLSLRGELETDKWQWYAESGGKTPEKASCCADFKPGQAWKDHCMTMKHIITMLRENYQGDELERQWNFYLAILMEELTIDEK